jgi:hypothetical protein
MSGRHGFDLDDAEGAQGRLDDREQRLHRNAKPQLDRVVVLV